MFRIGEFSKMSKTTVKTLRYYDETGLLKPEVTDKFTGYRLYTSSQLVKLHRIQAYRQAGLSINEIQLILSGADEKKILRSRKEEILSEIAEHKKRLSGLDFILSGKEEEFFMKYRAIIKETPECIVYSRRLVLPNYDCLFEMIPKIGAEVSEKYPDLKCTTPEYCFQRCLDSEYKEINASMEWCEAVTQMKPDFGEYHFKKIPSVKVVSVYHNGGYEGLFDAHTFAFKWADENGYDVVDGPRTSYIDGIWNKENKNDWLTEIQIPVVSRAEIKEKYGNTKQYAESQSKKFSDDEKIEAGNIIIKQFAELREKAPDSPEVQALVEKWQNYITQYYYACSKQILASLGLMYIADERFMQNMDRFGEGTTELMSKAIEIYCK